MFEVTVMLKYDSWYYLLNCWPRESLNLHNIQTYRSRIIISWIETMATLKPEKLLDFNWNSLSPFPAQKYPVCPVLYYCQGLLVSLLFISTLHFIMGWNMSISLHAHLISTSVTQFYTFIPTSRGTSSYWIHFLLHYGFLPLTHLNSSSTPDSIAAPPWPLLTVTDLIHK